MSSVKWKKYHLLSEKTKFSIFFGSRKRLACFFEKYFVLHLRLCLRQKGTDIFLGIKEIVVYKKSFLKMSQNLQKKPKKTPKLVRKKAEVNRQKSEQPVVLASSIRWHSYSIQSARVIKMEKSTTCTPESLFFSVFSLNFPAKKNIRHCRKIRHAQLNPWAPIYTW